MTFKKILLTKDKRLLNLYEVLFFHLNFINTTNDTTKLTKHQEALIAFKNGYVSKEKSFKLLRDAQVDYPNLNVDWMIEFIKFKIKHLTKHELKTLDELIIYAKNHSVLGYFLLMEDVNAPDHLDAIFSIAEFDTLSCMLINIDELTNPSQTLLPSYLISDYHLEIGIQGTYLLDQRFITLWQLIAVRVKKLSQHIQSLINLFNAYEQKLLFYIVEDRLKTLQQVSQVLAKNIPLVK